MKRRNPRGTQLVRGFLLGMAYAQGQKLTTARIRRLGASRATAKRDMRQLEQVVAVSPSKPVEGLKVHIARQASNDPRNVRAA